MMIPDRLLVLLAVLNATACHLNVAEACRSSLADARRNRKTVGTDWSLSLSHHQRQQSYSHKATTTTTTAWISNPLVQQRKRCVQTTQQGAGFSSIVPLGSSRSSKLNQASNDNSNNPAKLNSKDGVYIRPSGAIERGSGFFIPGLEGSKIRIVFGFVLIALTILNHTVSDVAAATYSFSEGISILYSGIVLLQGAVEAQKETSATSSSSSTTTAITTTESSGNVVSYQKQWYIPMSNVRFKESVEWCSITYLSLISPATDFVVVSSESILFSMTSTSTIVNNPDACSSAILTITTSQSGRVSVPTTHPVSQLFTAAGDAQPRTILLQKIPSDDESSQLCIVVASTTNPLIAFTKYDLRCCGQLAKYIAMNSD